ncbi:MAG: bifunctional phosphopantothenoylcysteine decarboxylase/phosphopantothenate--cysteine ligase CoaBC [Wenzhouxiangellaceae bacterium]
MSEHKDQSQQPISALRGQQILLGVSGGIAAYKAAELVRLLTRAGAIVQVVMTAGAKHFIGAQTLQALSGRPVRDDLWDPAAEAAMGHIELARWADRIVIAPATADVLARLRAGLADDLLTTLCLASQAPLVVAPAMNQAMWSHAATADNLSVLKQRGVSVLGPAAGDQACGDNGPGRMLEPQQIVGALQGAAAGAEQKLRGQRLLITAGPTYEDIDPVRFIGNRSSGRMGYALARVAAEQGAEVTLVSGPVALSPPPAVELMQVRSAEQMAAAVMARCDQCDIFIAAAAVADYRVAASAEQKIKKNNDQGLTLELVQNPDILALVASRESPPFTVGFAAETENLREHAMAKRQRKGVDMIAANWVGPGRGFDQQDNALLVIGQEQEWRLPLMNKLDLARELLTLISECRASAVSAQKQTGEDE